MVHTCASILLNIERTPTPCPLTPDSNWRRCSSGPRASCVAGSSPILEKSERGPDRSSMHFARLPRRRSRAQARINWSAHALHSDRSLMHLVTHTVGTTVPASRERVWREILAAPGVGSQRGWRKGTSQAGMPCMPRFERHGFVFFSRARVVFKSLLVGSSKGLLPFVVAATPGSHLMPVDVRRRSTRILRAFP